MSPKDLAVLTQSNGFTHDYDIRELSSRKQRIPSLVVINEYPDCPVCGHRLEFAFYTARKVKTYGGVSEEYQIPVCKCGDKNCSFRFVRILPDIMTPHKHYSTEVIENVVDEVCTPETKQTEDYPFEMTMERWKAWIDGNRNHVDGVLRSVGSRLFEFGVELLNSSVSLMDQLLKDGEGWLTVLNRIPRQRRISSPMKNQSI